MGSHDGVGYAKEHGPLFIDWLISLWKKGLVLGKSSTSVNETQCTFLSSIVTTNQEYEEAFSIKTLDLD